MTEREEGSTNRFYMQSMERKNSNFDGRHEEGPSYQFTRHKSLYKRILQVRDKEDDERTSL